MSTLKGFSGTRRFYAADPAMIPANRPAPHLGNNIIVRLIWIGLAALTAWLIYRHWTGSETPTVPPEPTAAVSSPSVPEVALTPIAPATNQTNVSGNAIRNPGVTPCVRVSAECGSIATPASATSAGRTLTGQTPVIRHTVSSDERKALAVVYPTSAPIPAGVDSTCFYADKYGVDCNDVKSATAQMLKWQAEEGR